MSKQEAQNEAIRRAITQLREADIPQQLHWCGLPEPDGNQLKLRLFGAHCILDLSTFVVTDSETGDSAKPADQLLLLHYLLCERPLTDSDELVPFREFSGGAFYLAPFRGRTCIPLARRYGNDIESLRTALHRFDSEELSMGDLSARIHALGRLYVTLVYRKGDEEFPPDADLLFNVPTRQALCAEDAVVMASRICIGLL